MDLISRLFGVSPGAIFLVQMICIVFPWIEHVLEFVKPPTSDDHIFFVRTPFWVFLDSMESPLSLESTHI